MTRPGRARLSRVCYAILLVLACGVPATAITAAGGWLRFGPNGPGVYNHPVDVVPSSAVTVPLGWPLSKGGAITCLTCHKAIPTDQDPQLRDPDYRPDVPTAFCVNCHEPGDLSSGHNDHWRAGFSAHVQPHKTQNARNSGSIDAQTRACMSCHDGASASESNNPTPETMGRSYAGDRRRDHPVGMDYRPEKFVDGDVPLRPRATLPAEVQLPEGKVSCVSCHNIYADTDYMLTVPVRGSKLCLTCHDLD